MIRQKYLGSSFGCMDSKIRIVQKISKETLRLVIRVQTSKASLNQQFTKNYHS